MIDRRIPALLGVALLGACLGGPPSPPTLEYGLPSAQSVTYDSEDETVVSISAMGQSMQLSVEGTVEYGIAFTRAPSGVGVSLTIVDLDATIDQPMGGPLQVDESVFEGALEFSLDRLGNASVGARPTIAAGVSQIVSGLDLAHTFFPGLPGRAVAPGDSWVDTVSYDGQEGGGNASKTSILEYRVVGDTTVAGHALLAIQFDGTSESSSDMEVSGMAVSQESSVTVEGHVLWDHQAGIMYESVRRETGSGSVSVPIAPVPFPIQIETTRRTRLQDLQEM